MAPPIHLGAWSMALMLWLPIELLLLKSVYVRSGFMLERVCQNECVISLDREEFAAVVLERVTSEFNRLQFNVSQTQDHPLIPDLTPVSV